MKVRITFKFKGSLMRNFITATVDAEIEGHGYMGMDEKESMMNEATEVLGCMITHGLVDVACDHAVDDFEVLGVTKDIPDEEADYIF